MTVQGLIDELKQYAPDMEVRIATNANYRCIGNIKDITMVVDMDTNNVNCVIVGG